MIRMTLSEVAKVCDGRRLDANAPFQGLSIDSRSLEPGNLFVALKGTRSDGHDFLEAAGQRGAAGALISRQVDSPVSRVLVDDAQKGLGQIARTWRNRMSARVVGITGSNGKTTVKEMLTAIVSGQSAVLATRGNFNNEIGLPLTLARLNETHRHAIIEMGAARQGDIAYLCSIARPEVGLVNNAGPAHLEGFGDLEGVARGKGELFECLPENGVAVINRDDRFFDLWAGMADKRDKITFGLDSRADVRGTTENGGLEIHTPVGVIEPEIRVPGRHNRLNALAATACALALDCSLEEITRGLESIASLPGRLEQHLAPGGWTVIDDTYNANPASLYAGLSVLGDQPGERWLVLGDMAELGRNAGKLHAEMGQAAREMGVSRLLALGVQAKSSVDNFGTGAMHFADRADLEDWLIGNIHPEVRCLVKGSRSMGMERIVEVLLKEQAA